jgi:hypothetical protein
MLVDMNAVTQCMVVSFTLFIVRLPINPLHRNEVYSLVGLRK